jgi:glycosyltransferase involved in cell wall biosynthesis
MTEENKIKIVHIIADSKLGGGPVHVLNLLKNLDKDRFECFLICPKGYLFKEAKEIAGLTVYDLSFPSKFDLGSYFSLKKLLARISSDKSPFSKIIVHSHGPRAGLFATFAAPKGAHKVFTEHIYDGNFTLNNPINSFSQTLIMRMIYKKSDMVVAVSSSVKEYLLKSNVNKNKIIVIPNGIQLYQKKEESAAKRLCPAERKNKGMVVGNLANLFPQKGQIYLMEAFSKVLKAFPDARLELIGDGPERENLESKVAELGILKNVEFCGLVNNPSEKMKNWNIFVMPSLSEPFGIAILEAMQAGIPVIASEVGGIVDIVNKDNGILVKPADCELLAKKIVELYQDIKLQQKLVEAGFETIKKFDWAEIVKKYEELYSSI